MPRGLQLLRSACLVALALGLTASSRAQGVVVSKAVPQAVYGVPQAFAAPQAQMPTPLYQGLPFTPRPIAPPRPVLTPASASPQGSAQGPAPCACYYPQGFCPMPQGNCAMPQGNCSAPIPYGPQPTGQAYPAPQYAAPQFVSPQG